MGRIGTSLPPTARRAHSRGRRHGSTRGGDAGRRCRGIADLDGAYALALDARFESVEDDLTVETNDVSAAFEAVLRWYAGNVADGTPPEAVIVTLLENSDLDVAASPAKASGGSTSR
ncbi:hypothetical protein [Halolamina pelagica]|uniref:DUF7500 family protein n=1 Tax=Halolamina pelagica TaxID=699431 RepID=UPI0006CA6C8C|nr:hypothetical protein [Halolamina pelagica]